MPATPEAKARTRAFARVIGPFLILVPAIVAARAQEIDAFTASFLENRLLVWMAAGVLAFSGLLIIAYHRIWSSPSAAFISLLGWVLVLRAAALLAFPQLGASSADGALIPFPAVRLGFGILFLIGVWLTFVGWSSEPGPRITKDR